MWEESETNFASSNQRLCDFFFKKVLDHRSKDPVECVNNITFSKTDNIFAITRSWKTLCKENSGFFFLFVFFANRIFLLYKYTLIIYHFYCDGFLSVVKLLFPTFLLKKDSERFKVHLLFIVNVALSHSPRALIMCVLARDRVWLYPHRRWGVQEPSDDVIKNP